MQFFTIKHAITLHCIVSRKLKSTQISNFQHLYEYASFCDAITHTHARLNFGRMGLRITIAFDLSWAGSDQKAEKKTTNVVSKPIMIYGKNRFVMA